jgi:hypothetical protein
VSSGELRVSSFWAKVIATAGGMVVSAGAAAAVATYTSVAEISVQLDAIERRVTTLETSRTDGDRDGHQSLRAIEGRLSAIEAKLEMLVEARP